LSAIFLHIIIQNQNPAIKQHRTTESPGYSTMKITQLHTYFFFLIVSCHAQDESYVNCNQKLQDVIESSHVNIHDLVIKIDKSEYTLSVICDTIVLKEYPVVFGKNPMDDKLMEGDRCTPEGTFNIVSKYPHKSWSKFIWINYPTNDSWRKHNAAKKDGIIPKDANIGGELGIHGVPEGMDKLIDHRLNWTLGCISLKNKDVNELYPYISDSAVIVIEK
jgi:murein L,D-transpeptidase YafK